MLIMRDCWGFYDNGVYRVGCNGATIYVYAQDGKELGRFKDIPYAYCGAFQPGTDIFIAKSTEGLLAIYDFGGMQLQKKIVITRIGAQDGGFAFSPDGKYFYNIECPIQSTSTQLAIYRTADYEVEQILFKENTDMVLMDIEFDKPTSEGHVLGFMRGKSGVMEYGFIGKFTGNDVSDIRKIGNEEYEYVRAYKDWERMGYTQKALAWNSIKRYPAKPHVSLKRMWESKCNIPAPVI